MVWCVSPDPAATADAGRAGRVATVARRWGIDAEAAHPPTLWRGWLQFELSPGPVYARLMTPPQRLRLNPPTRPTMAFLRLIVLQVLLVAALNATLAQLATA